MSAVASADRGQIPVFGAAIQGKRSEQQDSFRSLWLPSENAWLLLLADGMGGHAAGGIASRLAVEQFISAFTIARAADMDLKRAFEAAIERTNARISAAQREQPGRDNMGTTIVAAHLSHEGIAWVSIGDSPLWLFRGGRFYRLNEDHSLRELAREGAQVSANMLQSAVTGGPIEIIDYHETPIALHKDDLVVLASDGLLTLEEDAIAGEIGRNFPHGAEAVTRALLNAVEKYEKENQDNCTVIVASPPLAPKLKAAGSHALGRWYMRPKILVAVIVAIVAASSLYLLFG